MTRFLTTIAVVLLCAAPAGADVTLTQTMTVEGGPAAMMGGMTPRMVTRIKDLASRTDIDAMGHTMVAITDLTAPRMVVLDGATKTAQVFDPGSPAIPGGGQVTLPEIDMTFKPTGRSRVIEGASCDEHVFTMSMNMGEMGAGKMPPEAVSAMKDVRMAMSGSVWIAASGPGVADYVRFQKAASDAKMVAVLAGVVPGGQTGGLDRLMAAASAAPGLPYLTEMTMTFEGSGKVVEMMKQMGPIRMSQRISEISTDSIPAAMFEVPDDYKVVKP